MPPWNSEFLVHKSKCIISVLFLYPYEVSSTSICLLCISWKTSQVEDSGQKQDSEFLSSLTKCLLNKVTLQKSGTKYGRLWSLIVSAIRLGKDHLVIQHHQQNTVSISSTVHSSIYLQSCVGKCTKEVNRLSSCLWGSLQNEKYMNISISHRN